MNLSPAGRQRLAELLAVGARDSIPLRGYVQLAGGDAGWLKLREPDCPRQCLAEAEGLQALSAVDGIRVPEVIDVYEDAEGGYLLTTWLPLRPARDPARVGEALAAVHACTGAAYGWHDDTYLGSVWQPGEWAYEPVVFFRDRRLRPHLDAARRAGSLSPRLAERLAALEVDLPRLLADCPAPELVHGDFWGGNHALDDQGNVVLYDPSIAYAWGGVDLAFLEAFGGLHPRILDAYRGVRGAVASPALRALSALPILLAHLTMFGAMYAAQTERAVARALA